jgi:hypothetical protein
LVDTADDFQPPPLADHGFQQLVEGSSTAFHAGRHDAGRDYGRFEQAQVVAREIEGFVDLLQFGLRAQIDADQPQDRPVDHTQVGGNGGPRCVVATPHCQVD